MFRKRRSLTHDEEMESGDTAMEMALDAIIDGFLAVIAEVPG